MDHIQKKRGLKDAIYENLKGICAFPWKGRGKAFYPALYVWHKVRNNVSF